MRLCVGSNVGPAVRLCVGPLVGPELGCCPIRSSFAVGALLGSAVVAALEGLDMVTGRLFGSAVGDLMVFETGRDWKDGAAVGLLFRPPPVPPVCILRVGFSVTSLKSSAVGFAVSPGALARVGSLVIVALACVDEPPEKNR